MTKLGLVLSGGGSKGAYEIGVCLALKKLGKKPSIVTGTSIGAINGVFVAQKDLFNAVKMWRNINFGVIYDESIFNACSDDNIIDIYKEYAKSFITEGGMDVAKLDKVFTKYFKPRKFYNSNIDYGLVTYNLTKHKPKIMQKKDLSVDKIKDYVIASASCYPAFKPKKIKNDLYIDGGYYDNFPVNLAIDMGAQEIIGVDLRAVGFKQEVINKGVPVTVISPKNKIVSFLVFDKKQSREAIKFGYNDTLKKFRKLDGDYFTFKKGHLIKNYNKYNEKMNDVINGLFLKIDSLVINKIMEIIPIKEFFKNKMTYKNFNKIVENSGRIFGFKESKVYNIKSYNRYLLYEIYKTTAFEISDVKVNILNKNLLNIIDKRKIVRLFFDAIDKEDLNGIIKFIPLFSYEFLTAVYIYIIKSNKLFV